MPATGTTAALRELARTLPIPLPSWHRWVGEMLACRQDFEQALDAIEADAAASRELERLIEAGSATGPPASGEVASAWQRLAALPGPDGEHPFLDEILPTLEAMRAALLAVAASPAAAAHFAAAVARC